MSAFTFWAAIALLARDVLCTRSDQDPFLVGCDPEEEVCNTIAWPHTSRTDSVQLERSTNSRPTTDNVLLQLREARIAIVPTVEKVAQEANNTDSCGKNCMLHGVSASCQARVDWVKANVPPYTVESAVDVVNGDCVGQCFCTLLNTSSTPTTSPTLAAQAIMAEPTAAPTLPPPLVDSCNNRCVLKNVKNRIISCRDRVDWVKSNVKPYTLEHAISSVNAECVGQCTCLASSFGPENLTDLSYTNQYNASNPLSITTAPKREDNYFLIIGDWGRAGGPSGCQWKVANLMKQYVSDQRKAGKNLLAILTVGDNFYWAGATPTSWNQSWLPVYGTYDQSSPLFGIPWLSVLGNHDLGDTDPYAYCPDAKPLANLGGQAYGCQQFNADRNPTRPVGTELYWLPDYNYHYEIPEADLEFIFLDTNAPYISRVLYSAGLTSSPPKCGGSANINNFLLRVQKSGETLLRTRAKDGKAKTTVILQHYPEYGAVSSRIFEEALNGTGRATNVLGAYGHAHDQWCDGRDARGNCNMVLTGGGGGCCMGNFGGFTAVHLTADGGFITDVESSKVRLPKRACRV